MDNGGVAKPDLEILRLPNGVAVTLQPPQAGNFMLASEVAGGNRDQVPIYEMLLCITALNGNPEPKPRTRAMMIALADRLGRVGLDILNDWYQTKVFPEAMEALAELGPDARPDTIAVRINELRQQRLKNSLQTQ